MLSERAKRKFQVNIGLRRLEWKAIRDAAAAADLPVATFVREAAILAAHARLARIAALAEQETEGRGQGSVVREDAAVSSTGVGPVSDSHSVARHSDEA